MILSVRIQPETHVERMIKLGFPLGRKSLLKSREERVIDGDPSFSDQKLTSQITQTAESEVFSMINERDADKRFKREISRKRRDCDLSAKQCEILLQTVQNYLVALSNKFPATNGKKPLPMDILKCLECKQLQMNSVNENNEDHTLQSKDQYFPHDYAEHNRSNDSGITVIKLLDDGEAENGSKRTEVNRTEAAKIQLVETNSVTYNPSQGATNQSVKDTSTSETTMSSIDHTVSNKSQRIYVNDTGINQNSIINDKQPDSNLTANNSRVIKIQNDKSVPAEELKVDQQHRVIAESRNITSVKPWFTTESSSTRTHYSTVTRNNEQFRETTIAADSIGTIGTTETRTRTIIDLTKQITENVTSVPAGYDVTRIVTSSTVHPSMRPSFEGHPENRSITTTNGTWPERTRRGSNEIIKS